MKFRPLHDNVLVKRLEATEEQVGGIIIPDTAKEKPQEGEVLPVGKGKTNDEGKLFPLAVKEGDRILFGKYSGTEIKIDGEDFLIMKEEEVLGVVSGAHFNPVVTLAESWRGDLDWRDVPWYLGAQFLGAMAGVLIANVMFELPPVRMSHQVCEDVKHLGLQGNDLATPRQARVGRVEAKWAETILGRRRHGPPRMVRG